MKPSSLPEALSLHDSVVTNITYDEPRRTLRVELDLCAYMQRDYQEGSPELVPHQITFSGVSRVEAAPPLASLAWVPDVNDADVLAAKPITSGEDGVELVLHTMDHTTKNRDVLVLKVFGDDVAWSPRP